jgi:CheY-like chemotaxis protein
MIKRIFLADDDEDDAWLFKDVLSGLNKNVQLTIAVNGLKLIALLEQADALPDLIFTDLNMPLKNGFQCLQEIRSRPEWNSIKVIIHSTTSQQEQIDEAYRLGADLYLPKFTDYRQFRLALTKCLEMDWQHISLK